MPLTPTVSVLGLVNDWHERKRQQFLGSSVKTWFFLEWIYRADHTLSVPWRNNWESLRILFTKTFVGNSLWSVYPKHSVRLRDRFKLPQYSLLRYTHGTLWIKNLTKRREQEDFISYRQIVAGLRVCQFGSRTMTGYFTEYL